VAGISYLFPVNYPTIAANNLTNTGFIGGIQTGYNWQINSLVLGAEADFSGTTASGTVNASAPYPSHPFSTFNWATSVREDYFATIRGRASYAVGPVLIYGTGGLAIADVRFEKTFTDDFAFPAWRIWPGGRACIWPGGRA
jgi:outer membrane immunogenic protein